MTEWARGLRRQHRVLLAAALLSCGAFASAQQGGAPTHEQANIDARHYLGGADSSGYSSIDQVNKSNVSQLQVIWSYRSGPTRRARFQPIVVNGVMYTLGVNNAIVALDAVTGKELWVHSQDPELAQDVTDRGINYWESSDRTDRRLLFAAGTDLLAIDAGTGATIPSFGDHGRVDLRQGLGRDPESIVQVGFMSPGRVYGDLIIVGSRPGEAYTSPPGDVRAYDVRTGRLAWTFHTIPHPGEFGYETWPKDAYKTAGAANVWGDMSLDEKRGIVYLPIGSPTYDFYGANRKGANLFGNSLVALDARTGRRLWHFQMVHHDLWDYDNAAAPQLVTVAHEGKAIDAVALAGKTGFLYVFARVTGRPLWPIEERPVPASDISAEEAWPTQPFPTRPAPFARQSLTERDINPALSTEERQAVAARLEGSRNEGLFTPPSLRGTVQMPGTNGGANWGNTAADPAKGLVYVISTELPSIPKLAVAPPPSGSQSGSPEQIGQRLYAQHCAACHGPEREGRSSGPLTIPSLVDVTKRLDSRKIKRIVVLGGNGMPAIGVNDSDLNAIVAFLANPAAGAPTWPTGMAVSTDNGKSAATAMPAPASPAATDLRYWSAYSFVLGAVAPSATLTAYDLNEGVIKWQVPLGESAPSGGARMALAGAGKGAVVTAGGLIFIGTSDGFLRAYDKETGQQVWTKELSIAPGGVATTYQIAGRQYLAIHGASLASQAGSAARAGGAGDEQEALARAAAARAEGVLVVLALPSKER